jgi:hypothetical protein
MTRKDIQSYLEDMGEEGAEDIVLYDGLESAFIGVETHEDPESETLMLRAIYSIEGIIASLKKDMTTDEAWEHFHYNIESMRVGPNTPILINTPPWILAKG